MSIVKELREGLVAHVYESVEWLKSFSDNKEYQDHLYNLITYAVLTEELYYNEKYKREHLIRDLDAGARTGRCVVTTEGDSRDNFSEVIE